MSLARDTGWGLLASAVTAPSAFVASVVLARWLPPAAHGQVQAALSLLVLTGFLAQVGQTAAAIQRLARGGDPPGRVAAHGLLVTALTGGLVGAALLGASDLVRERLLLGAPPALLGLLVAALPLLLWMQLLGGVARAQGRFDTWTSTQLVQQVGRLALLVPLALLLPADPVLAVGAVLLSQAAATAFVAGHVLRRTGLARPEAPALRDTLRFGAWTWAHTLSGQLHERLDLFLLAALRGDPVEVAVYAVAVGVVNRVRTVPLALSAALQPRVAALSDADGARLTAQATRHTLLWLGIGGLLLAAVAPPLLPLLYGPTYAASVLPLLILLPATACLSVVVVIGRWFQAADRQGVNVAAQGLSVATNVALNLWWIPRYGAVGAAWASLASYTLEAAVVAGAFLLTAGPGPAETFLPRPADLRWYLDRVGARWTSS